jgi:hypothetical protein
MQRKAQLGVETTSEVNTGFERDKYEADAALDTAIQTGSFV